MVTKDFLKDVLSDEKKLLKMEKVRFINPPLYDELSVKSLYPKIIGLDGMAKYFPSQYPKGRQCCRQYMFNVWNTFYPEQVK
jgi:hypothetical protein